MSNVPMNLLRELPAALPEEAIDVLATSSHVRIERIVSHGHASPDGFWYDQAEAEWVVVLQGWGEIGFADGSSRRLLPGDHLLIPAHQRHRVVATADNEPTIWLAVFMQGDA